MKSPAPARKPRTALSGAVFTELMEPAWRHLPSPLIGRFVAWFEANPSPVFTKAHTDAHHELVRRVGELITQGMVVDSKRKR